MKSKKLFAILTLMAFMMTLLPMAAFGAVSAGKSSLSVSGLTVKGLMDPADTAVKNSENGAKFVVTLKDATGTVITTPDTKIGIVVDSDLAYVVYDSDGSDGNEEADKALSAAEIQDAVSDDGAIIEVTPSATGKVTLWFGAVEPESYEAKIYTVRERGAGEILSQIGSTKTVKVQRSDADIEIWAADDEDDTAPDLGYDKALASSGNKISAGEGFAVNADIGNGEEDVEVTFKQRVNGGSWTTIGKDETNDDGIAQIWVDAEKTGTYEFKAVSGSDNSNTWVVEVIGGVPDSMKITTAAGKTPVNEVKFVDIEIYDEAGNLVKDADYHMLTWEVTSAPSGSQYEDHEAEVSDARTGTDTKGQARIKFKPDEIGSYTIKIKLTDKHSEGADVNSDTATITFDAVKYGTVTSLDFGLGVAPPDRVPSVRYLEDDDDNPMAGLGMLLVWTIDENGVKVRNTNLGTDFHLSSSDPSVLTVNDDYGTLVVEDDDYIGPVTITAVYEEDNVVGTYEVNIAGAPSTFAVTPVVEGKTANVKVQLVDKNGNPTTSTSGHAVDKEALIVTAPSGVSVSGVANLAQDGAGAFTLTADEYGKYSITVSATVDKNTTVAANASQKTVSKTFEVEFVQPDAEKPVVGAKSVTMFIGAKGYVQDGAAKVMDVAPFIKDDRTFVPVRYLAEAFGATADWNEATQTVTLTRADMTLTIIIGQSAITKVADGVTTIVTADVPAFIMDGRTVLPFRAVGEAFGAEVSYDAATQAVSFVQ